MKESYLVPDYFPKFACKMGECRHPCCKDWPISISTDDYFRLLSVSCGPAMRERLDNAVRVSLHPTPEAYAQIAPTWAGDCPLHLPDGRCSVHAMLGADALPTICRLYPRGIRVEDGNDIPDRNAAVSEFHFRESVDGNARTLCDDFLLKLSLNAKEADPSAEGLHGFRCRE